MGNADTRSKFFIFLFTTARGMLVRFGISLLVLTASLAGIMYPFFYTMHKFWNWPTKAIPFVWTLPLVFPYAVYLLIAPLKEVIAPPVIPPSEPDLAYWNEKKKDQGFI